MSHCPSRNKNFKGTEDIYNSCYTYECQRLIRCTESLRDRKAQGGEILDLIQTEVTV